MPGTARRTPVYLAMIGLKHVAVAAALLGLGACSAPESRADAPAAQAAAPESGGAPALAPADDDDRSTTPYAGIADDDVVHFTGTEPFWGGEVRAGALTYSTPENPDGSQIAVERFAGRGGLAFSGRFDEQPFEMMVTPLACSDGMSDRTYPLTVTLKLGAEVRNGCGWTDAHPFEGPAEP